MKDLEVKKTPSALKWLAEKRARIAHDLEQTERIVSELTGRRDGLRFDLASLDRTLAIYDPAINPESIGSVNGWQGRAGKRGSLRATIVKILKSHEPEWVSTANIETVVIFELGLSFELPRLRKHWYDGSFRSTLKKLVADGLAEREKDPTEYQNEVGRWRWKQEGAKTLAELHFA